MELGSAISTDEAEVLAEYRSVSVLAIVALLLGLAAPLAFVAPLLMAVPVFGIAISLLAIIRIDSSEGRLVGRSAALIGLFLAVVCASAAPAYTFATRWLVSNQARDFAETWLDLLLSGESATAFQLTIDSGRPAPPAEKSAQIAAGDNDLPSPLESFAQSTPVSTLLELGDQASVRFRQTLACHHLPNNDYQVSQVFDVIAENDGSRQQPAKVELILRRRSRGISVQTADWRVEVCREAKDQLDR